MSEMSNHIPADNERKEGADQDLIVGLRETRDFESQTIDLRGAYKTLIGAYFLTQKTRPMSSAAAQNVSVHGEEPSTQST